MVEHRFGNILQRLFDPHCGAHNRLVTRWIFLRALAAIYFSAFYSLLFQIKGLIGPEGVLPAHLYLDAVSRTLAGVTRYWYAPSLFWLSTSSQMLMAVVWVGLIASIAAFLNLWPRLSFLVCFICYLSFVAVAGEFSGYQSDGMLLEAGFIVLFFVPPGLLPGWGANCPPSRASLFLLQWEWFRIYFESGMVKLLSGDPQWRHLTAMEQYYQNGPLPTWIGWYVQHLPRWFQIATAGGTLVLELGLVFMLFFPRRVRLICFLIVTPWEIGVILTANYTFLNYLVLSLGFLLLDDNSLVQMIPGRFKPPAAPDPQDNIPIDEQPLTILSTSRTEYAPDIPNESNISNTHRTRMPRFTVILGRLSLAFTILMLTWIGYDTTAEMISLPFRGVPLPTTPITALEPLRIANQYGLFAVMTKGRYEIEFQGSDDGEDWTPYLFRYKPQALDVAPAIYAPYQPRFDWNLWFASLGNWQQNDIVPLTEEHLLKGDADVLSLFKNDPFAQDPPRYVRAVLWQYWFTSMAEKKHTGNWWRRQFLGVYAPELTLAPDGSFAVVRWADELPPHN